MSKRRIAVGNVRLHVEIVDHQRVAMSEETAARTSVVALHGGPGLDGTVLRHQLAPLSDVAQVVVPDQRGHGRSDSGSPEDWNLATWASDVRRLCEALGIVRPVVLGQSFGGFVAQQFATAFPEEVAGLVLVSTAPRYPGAEVVIARARELRGDATAEALRRDIEDPTEDTSDDDQQLLRSLYQQHSDARLERLERDTVRTPEVARHWFPDAQQSMDLRPALRSVACPTLVLVGELDPLNPPVLAAEIVDAIPHRLACLDVVPGAAHRVLADNPAYALDRIRRFVDELSSAR